MLLKPLETRELALAALEVLVHAEDETLLQGYMAIPLTLPTSMASQLKVLPDDWRVDPIPRTTQSAGDQWTESQATAVLEIPSGVVSAESNFLINPRHPEFSHIEIGEPQPFDLDRRLAES